MLSTRLAHIRTWTYCASKSGWVRHTKNWINIAREVEDRLSDALHEALIERFVDRRTSKLLKGVNAETYMNATIKDNGDVYVDEQLIGQLEGLKFTLSPSGSELEAKAVKAAADKVVGPEVNRRLTSLCGGTHEIFTLSNEGHILWGGKTIGKISPSGTAMTPDAKLVGADYGNENLKALAENRMRDFLKAESVKHLAPLYELKEIQSRETTTSEAKGFAFTLLENNGSVERQKHWRVIKDLDQTSRRQLREANVQFGQYNIYIRDLMKPKAALFLSLVTSYGAGGDQKPFIPFAGVTSIANEGELSSEHYSPQALAVAGYRAVGPRIARFDILNRLSLQIRQATEQNKAQKRGKGFQIMQEMLAIMGCSYEEIKGVLSSLGFSSETRDLAQYISLESTSDDPSSPVAETAPAPVNTVKAQGDISEPNKAKENAPPKPQKPKPQKKAAKALNIYNHREMQEDGTNVEIENNEFWFLPQRQKPTQNRGHGKTGGHKKKYTKPKKTKNSSPNLSKNTPKPENSPFAALAALKTASKKD